MHLRAIGRKEADAPAPPIEDDFVVAHVGRADDRTVVLVVEDAETPDALAQLISILTRPKGKRVISVHQLSSEVISGTQRYSPGEAQSRA
jgi:hypothetical protein